MHVGYMHGYACVHTNMPYAHMCTCIHAKKTFKLSEWYYNIIVYNYWTKSIIDISVEYMERYMCTCIPICDIYRAHRDRLHFAAIVHINHQSFKKVSNQ